MTKKNAAIDASSQEEKTVAREYSPAENLDDDEWDDTPTALFLRALFTLLSGAFLIFCVTRAPLSNFDGWRVTQSYLLAFLVLPLGIVWLFFAQTLRHVDYLRNQALNAWNYGWNFSFSREKKSPDVSTSRSLLSRVLASQFLTGIALGIVFFALMFFAARADDARAVGSALFPANASTRDAAWLPFLILSAFCREWFFRGFLLFGLAQGFRGVFAPIVGIATQAVLFAAAMGSAQNGSFVGSTNLAFFVVGLLFGIVAWKQKSFASPFFAHALALLAAHFLLR